MTSPETFQFGLGTVSVLICLIIGSLDRIRQYVAVVAKVVVDRPVADHSFASGYVEYFCCTTAAG